MYGKYTLFYESPKNLGYYAHAQTVCTRPLLGGEGPGDEAKMQVREQYPGTSIFALVSIMPRPLSEKSRGAGHGTIFALPCKMVDN